MRNQAWLWALVVVIIVGGLAYFFWPIQKAVAPTEMNPVGAQPEQATTTPTATASTTASTAPATVNEFFGTWKSDQDAKFTREFMSDGRVVDKYAGDAKATMTGSWGIVANPSAEPVKLPDVGGATVLKLKFPDTTMYFAVTGVSSTNLSMNYLNGNGALNFTKVQ